MLTAANRVWRHGTGYLLEHYSCRLCCRLTLQTSVSEMRSLQDIQTAVSPPPTYLTSGPPGCLPAVGPHRTRRCESRADSWDTGRRSCSAPCREPAGTSHMSSCDSASRAVRILTGAQITGTLTLLNISAPLRASSSAMSCGVDTMTAPAHRAST